MSEYGFTKKDWALFREKVADWQEAYMDKLNKEYIDLLNGDGRPSEKFWALEERIRNDKKDTGVQLRMSRSTTATAHRCRMRILPTMVTLRSARRSSIPSISLPSRF